MSVDEWDQRVLCPNGACNGVIGPDGTCKVCGHVMPNWGDERMRGLSDDPEEDAVDEDEDDDEDLADDGDDDEGDDEADDDDDDDDEVAGGEAPPEWEERKLCDDGACVGVIADNGLCTVCGKRSAA
jgi:hypothetical protein